MEVIKFKFDTKKLHLPVPEIHIYPLVCLHLGAAQSDVKFIKEQIKLIQEDPCARWVYMGDGGECVTKLSKGNIYAQILSPQQQQDYLVKLLRPIRAKGLFGIRGNHGNRIDKETGLSFDKTLCCRLGLPYLGVSCFAYLQVNRSSYSTYWHHGSDSGTPLATKIRKAEEFATFVEADAIFTAHSHIAVDLPPAHHLYADASSARVHTRVIRQYICGSAYDSRSGYAEERGYRPILPSWICVRFGGSFHQHERSQDCTIRRSSADYPLDYSYLKSIPVDPDQEVQ